MRREKNMKWKCIAISVILLGGLPSLANAAKWIEVVESWEPPDSVQPPFDDLFKSLQIDYQEREYDMTRFKHALHKVDTTSDVAEIKDVLGRVLYKLYYDMSGDYPGNSEVEQWIASAITADDMAKSMEVASSIVLRLSALFYGNITGRATWVEFKSHFRNND